MNTKSGHVQEEPQPHGLFEELIQKKRGKGKGKIHIVQSRHRISQSSTQSVPRAVSTREHGKKLPGMFIHIWEAHSPRRQCAQDSDREINPWFHSCHHQHLFAREITHNKLP